jgi:DNA-binding LacI/PurR family transcriptional regulator
VGYVAKSRRQSNALRDEEGRWDAVKILCRAIDNLHTVRYSLDNRFFKDVSKGPVKDNRLSMTPKQTRISIKDVAERAGVSKCTVSKVLNGKSARITDATREHVQSIARELGYEPNHFARLLGKNDTRIIGVLIHNITNPIYARAVEVLEETLYHHGYQALFEVPGIAVAEDIEQRGSKLRGWPVDGFLFWCSREFDIAFFHGTAAKEIPSLYLEVAPPDEKPCILLDLYGGGVLAAKHLLENGYVAVAHVAFGIGEAAS